MHNKSPYSCGKTTRRAKNALILSLGFAAATLAACYDNTTLPADDGGTMVVEPAQVVDRSTNLLPSESAPWSGTAPRDIGADGVTIFDGSADAYAVATRLLKDVELSDKAVLSAIVEVADGTEHSTIRFGYTTSEGAAVKNDIGIKHDTKATALIRGNGNITSESTENSIVISATFDLPYSITTPYVEVYPASSISEFKETAEATAAIKLIKLTIK